MDYRPIVGTTSVWASNDKIIPAREVAVEVQTDGKNVFKVGDGVTVFSALPVVWEGYPNAGSSGEIDELAAQIQEVRDEVRPIARGGTGASTVEAALANLGAAPTVHTHSQYLTAETDPTVPSWAKAASKPSYTAAEVGASPTGHTHNYAASASAGGDATNALSLGGTLAAQFVTLTGAQALTNKTYNGFTLAAACAKAVDTAVTGGSANLITSGAVSTALSAKLDTGATAAAATKLATARNLTIGVTAKAFDGTAAVSWTLAEIGAAAASHAHAIADVTGLTDALSAKADSSSITSKADKKVPAATGNIATLDASGNLADGGVAVSGLATAGHTHNYAGSSTPGGDATNALSLGGTLAAQFVTLTGAQALTNKTYNGYTLAAACAKAVDTAVTNASANLITSGAVYTALSAKLDSGANAVSATKLATARNITIGVTVKSFDGTGNVSWTLAEIGAAAASHSHATSEVTGLDTALAAKADATALTPKADKKVPAATGNIATLDVNGNLADGGVTVAGLSPVGHTHNYAGSASAGGPAATALKLNTARTIGLSGVTATAQSFDGSGNITVPITAVPTSLLTGSVGVGHGGTGATDAATARTNLGAAAASHAHAVADVTGLQTALDSKLALPNLLTNIDALADGDAVPIYDANGADINNFTMAQLKAFVKTYFDTLYSVLSHTHNYAGAASSGAAATSALKLNTARTINGASFDGTANITFSDLYPEIIPSSVDLNSYTQPGMYYCPFNATVATLTNSPTSSAFFLLVGEHAGTFQLVVEYMSSGFKVYLRNYYYDTGWGTWYRMFTTANPPTPAEVGALALGGGTLTGAAYAHVGTDYTTARMRNIALVTALPSVTTADNGKIFGLYQ